MQFVARILYGDNPKMLVTANGTNAEARGRVFRQIEPRVEAPCKVWPLWTPKKLNCVCEGSILLANAKAIAELLGVMLKFVRKPLE